MTLYNVSYVATSTASTTANVSNNIAYFTTAPVVKAQPQPVAVKDEDPIAWLRRRVDEVCWQPA